MTNSTMTSAQVVEAASQDRVIARMRALYHEDHQVKFLDLQAEADSLLQQLQALKAQRAATPEELDRN